ncbi:MAG: class I SAM-dependent methyltransferase [Thermoplasmata archaeon]|nr:class I SAM-dependent methyltransferase [Thermoplasmata archaeon]
MQVETNPDVSWVVELGAVEERLGRAAVVEASGERRLFQHLARQHRAEGRTNYIEIDAPLELYALARLLTPLHVVEVGVSSGVSSAYLLQALDRNGKGTLHSIDLPKLPSPRPAGTQSTDASWSIPAGRQSGWAVPFALRKRWDLRLGNKRDLLPLFGKELPRIDLFVYDVPHDDAESWKEFRGLSPLLHPGGVAIADHGPGGGLCLALRKWARQHHAAPARRAGLGLYGFRCR